MLSCIDSEPNSAESVNIDYLDAENDRSEMPHRRIRFNRRERHLSAMDETDLALVNVLQIHPRVTWSDAAEVLGVSAPSLATRWERLRSRGEAWVTATPNTVDDATVAFINVQCSTGAVETVAATLALDPRIVSIDLVSPGDLLHVTSMTRSVPSYAEMMARDLPAVAGVVGLTAYLATALHRSGGDWRVGVLGPAQRAHLERLTATRSTQVAGRGDGERQLLLALFADGRATAADMARSTDLSSPTIRRRLTRFLATDAVALRCDISHEDAGWPVASTWWVKVPPVKSQQSAQMLSSLAAVRFCASVAGSSNMVFTTYTHELSEILRIERAVGENLPWLDVQDIVVNLRAIKRMGWLLDSRGRATGETVVPEVFVDAAH